VVLEAYSLEPATLGELSWHLRIEGVATRDFGVSPRLPLLVTTNHNSDLFGWTFAAGGPPQLLGDVNPGVFSSRPRFDRDGNRAFVLQGGRVVATRVGGGVSSLFREIGQDCDGDDLAVMGPDETLLVLEREPDNRDNSVLRVLPQTRPDDWTNSGGVLQFTALAPACPRIVCVSAATEVERFALCCDDGTVRVFDGLSFLDRTMKVFESHGFPLTRATLSRDGTLLAAVEGDRDRSLGDGLVVWQVADPARPVALQPGPRPTSYPPRVEISPSGRLVAVDRDAGVTIYTVTPR
jgi:hypothetical protein